MTVPISFASPTLTTELARVRQAGYTVDLTTANASTTPTSGVGVSGFAPTGVRAPSGPTDTSPSAWLPLSGTSSGGLAISGGGVTLAPVTQSTSTSGTSSAPPPPSGSGSGQTLLGATGGTPIDTTGGPVGTPAQDTLTNRLLDLIAAQYASGAQGGQSPDFGGLLTAPVGPATGAPDTTGMGSDTTSATTPTSKSHVGLVLVLLILAGGGYWYYRKHHKKRAA